MSEPEPGSADARPEPLAPAEARPSAESAAATDSGDAPATGGPGGPGGPAGPRKRRRGSRGGRGRTRPRPAGEATDEDDDGDDAAEGSGVHDDGDDDEARGEASGDDAGPSERPAAKTAAPRAPRPPRAPREPRVPKASGDEPELPERAIEGKVQSPEVAERVLVRRPPQIGDSRPAPAGSPAAAKADAAAAKADGGEAPRKRRRGSGAGGTGNGGGEGGGRKPAASTGAGAANGAGNGAGGSGGRAGGNRGPREGGGRQRGPVRAVVDQAVEVDEELLEARRGRERKGRPIGRYLMAVHNTPALTQIAVLEGRSLIEHYVSRPSDDVGQIHGNIYLGRVQNVLPGMEAAFVDIGTPKNAVLYRGDVQYDAEDLLEPAAKKGERPRIEQMLKAKQLIVCQVTKNPIGAKGARLTQEVSLPGRFVVLIPNSKTYGISKRLADDERKRLRSILDKVKPAEHGVIVRTAAENVVEEELRADVQRLLSLWDRIDALAKKAGGPKLLYREPDMSVRVIREEFNKDYRGVVIDNAEMYEEVKGYVSSISPALADRVELYDAAAEGLPLFERHHVHEQLHKALDRKVWLPSGGSLIIEHTEALTVIDVNTGKNVGTSNLEETVFHNNLEAADEIARQLRLRDIGGIIVIDFIDMEIKENRHKVVAAFREALARDKTRTQVFDISELGLVEMTRKRIGEGLLTSFADPCPMCDARGVVIDHALLE